MARHHHHHHSHDGQETQHAAPRSSLVRLLSISALALPLILFIISFAFALKTLYEPDFALSDDLQLFDNGTTIIYPSAEDPLLYKAGPFYNCTAASESPDTAWNFTLTCTRKSTLGPQSYYDCIAASNYDNRHFCQKSAITGQLFVAGTILIGLSFLFAIITLITGWRRALAKSSAYQFSALSEDNVEDEKTERHGPSNHHSAPANSNASALDTLAGFSSSFVVLLAVGAVVTIVAGQAIGISTFVDDLSPTGEDSSLDTARSTSQSSWYMGPGAILWPSVSWLTALFGVVIALSGCGVGGR